jgi:REP element-mobilizing transposase RayT
VDAPPTAKIEESKVWHSRGYLPHYDIPGAIQLLTFRLADSLPQAKLLELADPQLKLTDLQKRNRLDAYLDTGWGKCLLGDPRIAGIAQNTLLHFDRARYNLLAWVVMPNHVHALAEFNRGHEVAKVLHSWKSFIAHETNKLLARSGPLFQREYHDRMVRNEDHLVRAIEYIHANPVKARLVESPTDWRFSSAGYREQ